MTCGAAQTVPVLRAAFGEAGRIAAVAAIAAAIMWTVRPSARAPLRGSPADLLEWRARLAGLETLRLPHAIAEVRRGSGVWLDVRPLSVQRQGRIPWAVPFPAGGDPHGSLPPVEHDRPLVLYCDSAACDSAFREALRLRAAGFSRVTVFIEGYAGWVAAGGEVERPASEASGP